MGQVMSFLFSYDCADKEDIAPPVPPPVVPYEDSQILVRALVQSIIYEKNQFKEPSVSNPECVTKFLLKNYEKIEACDLNDRYEHSDEALFIREMDNKEDNDAHSFSFSFTCLKQTLLTLAARYSSPEIFAHLLSHPDIDPNITDGEGNAPLHIAAKLGRMNIVACLVQDSRTDIDKKDGQGKDARRLSIKNRYVEIEELIMKASADHTEASALARSRSSSSTRLT